MSIECINIQRIYFNNLELKYKRSNNNNIFPFLIILVTLSTCKAKIDLGFILDSSGSLKNEYYKEKDFLKVLAKSFNISPDGSRAGVVTFSVRAEHSIRMKDHTDITSLEAAVDDIPIMGMTTRIDRALRLPQKELFAPENGGRPELQQVLILLTDGTQTKSENAEHPGDIAEEIRKSGITVIVIGVGDGIAHEELDHMAGGAGKAYIAKSFDELIGSEFVKKIAEKSCREGKINALLEDIDEHILYFMYLCEYFKMFLGFNRLQNVCLGYKKY